ncbi:MAG: hypothetical protein GTO30_11900 [Acidobacteria bacterium]|nr:hypothetical protein [Acidobacteriota bacterium]NIM62330.1 hypothetical protein [Acidobacteriota bacterium]NIO60663.1 hypothetical protein [Acidobacteriota bacterium]NIQ85096.1 hypothetical protein [Acidobacteriota bacterium]NIT12307.1 hypothetical protein [Acidobacteriota bacterium]
MQALKDAGILLVVILLALSVRLTPLEETGTELDLASLTPQTDAAPAPRSFEFKPASAVGSAGPATAVVVGTPEESPIHERILKDGEEIVRSADLKAQVIQHCTEMVIHIKNAAEQLRNEEVERDVQEVVKVLPCSA